MRRCESSEKSSALMDSAAWGKMSLSRRIAPSVERSASSDAGMPRSRLRSAVANLLHKKIRPLSRIMSDSPLLRYYFPARLCPTLKGNAGGLLEQPARFRNRESHASRIGDAPLVQSRAVRLGGAGVENSSRATRSAHGPAPSLHLSTQTAGLRRCTSLVEAEYRNQVF